LADSPGGSAPPISGAQATARRLNGRAGDRPPIDDDEREKAESWCSRLGGSAPPISTYGGGGARRSGAQAIARRLNGTPWAAESSWREPARVDGPSTRTSCPRATRNDTVAKINSRELNRFQIGRINLGIHPQSAGVPVRSRRLDRSYDIALPFLVSPILASIHPSG